MVHIIDDVRSNPALPRAYDSLTQQYVAFVLQVVGATRGAWQIDEHKDYQGHLTILVAPSDIDGDTPIFVVSGRLKHIELARLDGEDNLCECGCFSTIEAAAAALAEAISSCPGMRG